MTFPAVALPSAVTAAVTNANGMMGQMGGRHGGRGFGGRGFDGRHGGPLMFIVPLLLFATAAFGIGMLLRRRKQAATAGAAGAGVVGSSTTGPTTSGEDMAGAILRERFARGDINEVEYLHRKAVLEGRANVPANAPITTSAATTSTPASSDDPTVVADGSIDPTA